MPLQTSPKTVLGLLSLLAVLGILACTLWPFQPFPPNEVSWLPDSPGIRFGKSGVVLTRRPISMEGITADSSQCSIELWLKPAGTHAVSTILDIYQADNPFQFQIRQYLDGLIVSQDSLGPDGSVKRTKLDLDHGLQAGKLSLLTLSFSDRGTSLYLDGVLKQSYPKFILSAGRLTGQLILGTAPVNSQPWMGEIHGLALYGTALSPDVVQQHFQQQQNNQENPHADVSSSLLASYAFREAQGQTIQAQANGPGELWIPPHFFVPHQAMLAPPWKEYDPGWEYWADVLRNIAGFMPLGLFLCAYFCLTRSPCKAILLATLAGFSLSFCVELVQAYLPQRVSGVTDILTNGSGAALGAIIGSTGKIREYFERWAIFRG